MAALHLVNRSPTESRALEQCLARCGAGDAVLLMEEAVYAVSGGLLVPDGVALYVLQPDLEARGLTGALPDGIVPVDYRGFVALTTRHQPILSWS